MGSRLYNQNTKHLENEVVTLYAKITIGASGAPTLTRGKGIASVTGGAAATATGLYTLTLDDKYPRLLYADAKIVQSGAAIDLRFNLSEEDVASAKTVVFGCVAAAVLTDPASADVILVELVLGNSAV